MIAVQQRFDCGQPIAVAVPDMTTRETKRESYHALKGLGPKQQDVLSAIRLYGPISDRKIADFMAWPINRVTPRRGELAALGAIVQAGTAEDIETGRRVALWAVA